MSIKPTLMGMILWTALGTQAKQTTTMTLMIMALLLAAAAITALRPPMMAGPARSEA